MATTAASQPPPSLEVTAPGDDMEISSEYNRFDDDIDIDIDLTTDADIDYMLEDGKSDVGEPLQNVEKEQESSKDDLMVDQHDDDRQSDLMQDTFSAPDEQLIDADANEINYDEEQQELQLQQEDFQTYGDAGVADPDNGARQGAGTPSSTAKSYQEAANEASYAPVEPESVNAIDDLDHDLSGPKDPSDGSPPQHEGTAHHYSSGEDIPRGTLTENHSADAGVDDHFGSENGAQGSFVSQDYVGHPEPDVQHHSDYYAEDSAQQRVSSTADTDIGPTGNDESLPATTVQGADADSTYLESEQAASDLQGANYDESGNNPDDNRKDRHCILVMYGGNEFSLFPPQSNEPQRQSILQNFSIVYDYLSDLFASLRQGLGNNISDAEELEISVPELDLYVSEDSKHASNTTLNDILDTHKLLQYNNGVNTPDPFVISLTTQTRFAKRLEYLRDFAMEGGLMSNLATNSDEDASHDFNHVEDSGYQYDEGQEGNASDIEATNETEAPEEVVDEPHGDYSEDPTNVASQEYIENYPDTAPQEDASVLNTTVDNHAVAEPDSIPDNSHEPTRSNSRAMERTSPAQGGLSDSVEALQDSESASASAPATITASTKATVEEDDLIDYEDEEEENQDQGSSGSSTIQGEPTIHGESTFQGEIATALDSTYSHKEAEPLAPPDDGFVKGLGEPVVPRPPLQDSTSATTLARGDGPKSAVSAELTDQTEENFTNNNGAADSITFHFDDDASHEAVSEDPNIKASAPTLAAPASLRGGEDFGGEHTRDVADSSLEHDNYQDWNDDNGEEFTNENSTSVDDDVFGDPVFDSNENWEEYVEGEEEKPGVPSELFKPADANVGGSNDEDEITYEDEDEDEETGDAAPQTATTETYPESTPKVSPGTKRTFSEHLESDSVALGDEVKRVRSQ